MLGMTSNGLLIVNRASYTTLVFEVFSTLSPQIAIDITIVYTYNINYKTKIMIL